MNGRILITGGAGTLGTAIIRKAKKDGWDAKFTVYSRDPLKQHKLKREFPDVVCVTGDIGDYSSLQSAMAGHDIVIHAAALKHIPECEYYPQTAYEVNVVGSLNVIHAAMEANIKKVVGISTDKVCYPLNAYGTTKKMLEYLFASYGKQDWGTDFLLVRYGNVLGSNGSVVQVWSEMAERDGKIRATSPDMTRFWLTVEQAVDIIDHALDHTISGNCYIPKLPALSMAKMHQYLFPEVPIEYSGLRPGEKYHEVMITAEETVFADEGQAHGVYAPFEWFYDLYPTTSEPRRESQGPTYSSDKAIHELTKGELLSMVSGA